MGLNGLFCVMFLKWREVFNCEVTTVRIKVDCDSGTKHRQPLAKSNDLLFVKPQKCSIHEFVWIFY